MSIYANKNLIWLSVPGGIEGWKPEEFNKYVLEWNNNIRFGLTEEIKDPYYHSLFFEWLSYETKENYSGFAWCNQNTDFATIKTAGGKA